MWNIIEGFDTLITEYQYNSQDQITMYSHYGSGSPRTFRNSFDYAGRLSKVEFYAGAPDAPNPEYVTLAEYSYNENSQVSQQQLNGGGVKNNFYYDNRNRISTMQNSSGIFEYTNAYFKNGNVKSQEILGSYKENFDNTTDLNLTYTYDKSNRLLQTENANQQYKDNFKLENAYDKDGNILELKRYDGDGSLADNFNYTYYSNSNKLQRVTGSVTQYTYDANGNMLTDDFNRNKDIKYDYRNLIIQVRHKKIIREDSLVYVTYYNYDEAGNRIRKKVYQYIGTQNPDSSETPDAADIGDAPALWELVNDEVYSRGVDGKELAIYVNWNIKQTNIWGIGNEGYITTSDVPNFYLKDHLGSIRIVTNENDEVISAQDYDCWGYLLEGREYESDESVYKFTGKERDEESEYDYFGARYYDARIGRWGQVEPLFEQYIQFSPYAYSICNPARFVDPMGLSTNDVILAGSEDDRNRALSDLQNETDLDLTMDANGKLSVKGKAKTKFDKKLKAAIRSKTITVTLNIIEENYTTDENGMRNYVIVGQYGGSSVDAKNITQAIQYINLNHAEVWNQAGGSSVGLSIKHEIVEAFIGAEKFPGQGFSQANYEIAHSRVRVLEGNQFYPPHGLNPQGTEMRLQDANGLPHLLYNIEP